MEYRQLGKTGLTVSTVGFGGWAIGGDAWGPVDDADSLAAIAQALDLGVTLFDTADVYGRGRSEELLGRALRGRRDDVVISTKVGLWDSHMDVSPNIYSDPKLIYERCDESLRRLGTDHVDVYLCHLWWDENTDVFLEAFAELQRRGKIRACGVSTDDPAHLRHFDGEGTCGVVQFDYSIVNRAAEAELLPYAASRELGTIVRGPLRMGLLTGKFDASTTFPEDDIRHSWPAEPWFGEALATVEGLRGVGEPAELAVGFVLAHPAVDAAIPGAKTAAQMAANAAAGARALAPDELRRIEELAPA